MVGWIPNNTVDNTSFRVAVVIVCAGDTFREVLFAISENLILSVWRS